MILVKEKSKKKDGRKIRKPCEDCPPKKHPKLYYPAGLGAHRTRAHGYVSKRAKYGSLAGRKKKDLRVIKNCPGCGLDVPRFLEVNGKTFAQAIYRAVIQENGEATGKQIIPYNYCIECGIQIPRFINMGRGDSPK